MLMYSSDILCLFKEKYRITHWLFLDVSKKGSKSPRQTVIDGILCHKLYV